MGTSESFIRAITGKRITHSGEDFDNAQHLAWLLTEEDRRAGRPAPFAGYSAERAAEAKSIVARVQGRTSL